MKHGRHSVRVKMFFLTFGAIAGTVALCIVLNEFFLVKYYERSKQKQLGKGFEQINELILADDALKQKSETEEDTQEELEASEETDGNPSADEYSVTDETRLKLDILCSQSNLSVVVVKDFLGEDDKPAFVLTYVFGVGGNDNQGMNVVKDMLGDYFLQGFSGAYRDKELEKETESYSIYSLFDKRMQSKYIELVGILENNDIVILRTNVVSMQESMKAANIFLIYVGLISSIIVSFIMYFVSRNFTRPILQLAENAKRMSELDFDVHYKVKTNDEIGELGSSINFMSDKLRETVTELKSANNELQMDIEKKTQADEMRKDFLSNVTHELKTPIALIQGYAEGLKDNINDAPEDREFYCDVIIDEAVKMNEMVKKLLTLNRLEFGTTPVEIERFELIELIKSVLTSTEILAKQKQVTVEFLAEGPCFVWADEYMMEEVLMNYISNAYHHVAGENRIEVRVTPNGEHVRVSVFNTGECIPQEDIPNLWIKFYKVDKARTREYGGTGIGLSIVKAVMEAHNQEYGVVNHENGVEFWFELDSHV